MLNSTGVEDEGIHLVRQFGGGRVRPRKELRSAVGGRERQSRPRSVGPYRELLADSVVDVTDRVAGGAFRGDRPLHRLLGKLFVRCTAQVVTGDRVGRAAELV